MPTADPTEYRYVRLAIGKNLVKVYNLAGVKFEGTKGWYKVDVATAERLIEIRQQGEGSALAFEIVDEAGYQASKKRDVNRAQDAGLPLPVFPEPRDVVELQQRAARDARTAPAEAKVVDADAPVETETTGDLTTAGMKGGKKRGG